jgi:outer membrane receptor protein involved in Fe transport
VFLTWCENAAAEAPDTTVVVVNPLDRTADPVSGTVVRVEDLPFSADLSAALEPVPGLRVRQFGGLGDFSGVSIRGNGLRQTQVFLDGVPLSPDGAAVVNLAELPLRAFRRVDVYRGNAPAALGAAPLGGVVNLITGDGGSPSVSVTAGTQGTVRASMGGVVGRRGFVFVDALHTDGDFRYFRDNGTTYNRLDDALVWRANNDKTQLAAHGALRLGGGARRWTIVGSGVAREEGLPGHLQQRTEAARLETARALLGVETSAVGASQAGSILMFAVARHERVSDPLGEIGVGSDDTVSRIGSLGVRGDWRLLPHPRWVVGVTGQARLDGWWSADGLRTRWVGTGSTYAIWRSGAFALGPTLDVRAVDPRALGASPRDGASSAPPVLASVDPRLGASWRIGDTLLKVNAGKYLRVPDLTELYGQRGSSVGNPELVPERGYQADLGVMVSAPSLGPATAVRGEATLFASMADQLIVWVQNSQQVLYPVNLGRGVTAGVESAGAATWGPLVVNVSATWTWSANRSEDPAVRGKALPRVPMLDASAGASVALPALPWCAACTPSRVGWDVLAVSANWWDATNWRRSAPRTLHAASLAVELGQGVGVELRVSNVLNRLVEAVPRNPLDASDETRVLQPMTDFVGYPLPGRTALLTLRWAPR